MTITAAERQRIARQVLIDPLLAERAYAALGIYGNDGACTWLVAAGGTSPLPIEAVKGWRLIGRVAETGKPEQSVAPTSHAPGVIPPAAAWAVPIAFEDRVLGVVVAVAGDGMAFDAADEGALIRLAALAAPLLRDPDQDRAWRCLTAMADLRHRFPQVDWAGTYRIDPDHLDELILGCQVGPPTPHTRIPVASGICGAAIREAATLNIPDVQADARFIACSISTRSELVVPIRNAAGDLVAEIDLDSDTPAAFSPAVTADVEALAVALGRDWGGL